MTPGIATPTLHTAAAAAGDGLRMFGLPWWFPLALLPLLAVVVLLLEARRRRRRYAECSDDRG